MTEKQTKLKPWELICPCCGKTVVDRWDICEECGWQTDNLSELNPDMPSGGPMHMSLNEARQAYKEGRPIH